MGQAFWQNEILCQNFPMLRQAFWCCCLIVLVLSLPPTGGSDMDLSGFWGKVQISMTFAGLNVLGLIAMGLLIELIQSFAPWQYSEPDDLLAVMTGIMIVRVIWVVAFRR